MPGTLNIECLGSHLVLPISIAAECIRVYARDLKMHAWYRWYSTGSVWTGLEEYGNVGYEYRQTHGWFLGDERVCESVRGGRG